MNNETRIKHMQTLLQKQLQTTYLNIIDDSHKHIGHAGARGGAGHFTVEISSPLFANQSRLACHKMIYTALQTMMPQDIHALQIKLLADQ